MSDKACQKEIICMRMAINKLDAITDHIEMLFEMSENNYRHDINIDLEKIEENTKKMEQIINQAEKLTNILIDG